MRLCIITCYNQPDYVRAKTLRAAANGLNDVEVIIVKNTHTGLLRYAEVFAKVIRSRLRDKPDTYILTFRGYEMLLPVRLLTLGKPLLYDEFINPIEWVVKERRQVEAKLASGVYRSLVAAASKIIVFVVASWPFRQLYRLLVLSTEVILTDTSSHADVSAVITNVPRTRFIDIPVGVDEETFHIDDPQIVDNDTFTVFYYGNMLPLHGLKYVIEAAIDMKSEAVKFVLVGGNAKVARDVNDAVAKGANIDYSAWVKFAELPKLMSTADLCLAGPFGDTFQSRYVITGKAFQYLAMGRPTVVGKNEESHAFTDRKNALVVRQGSAEELVRAIRWGLENRGDLQDIGRAGQELYKNTYATKHLSGRLKLILARFDRIGNPASDTDKK